MKVRGEAAHMRCHPLAALEDLDRVRREASLHLPAGELIRNAVKVAIHLDVVIDGGADRLPVGGDVRLCRQRLKDGLVDGGEQ
jgi:hypothetical protein